MRWPALAAALAATAAGGYPMAPPPECASNSPTLVWMPSVPSSGSHLSRRLIEAATGLCTYAIYPEGAPTPLIPKRLLDAHMTGNATASTDNARHRKKLNFEPCRDPRCLFVVKTHSSATSRPPSALAAHFPAVRVLRLIRNPHDNVLRGLYGDPRAAEAKLSTRGANATAPQDPKRLATIATRAKWYARFHAFWADYGPADQLVVRYEKLALDPLSAGTAATVWLLSGGAHDGDRLAAAAAHERAAVADATGQIGKESVRLSDRVWRDGSAYCDAAVLDAVDARAAPVLAAYGYARLAAAFRVALQDPGSGPPPGDLLDAGTYPRLV